jgi:hypothetical protein
VALDHHDGTFDWRCGCDEDEYRRIDGRWKLQCLTMWSDSVRESEFVDRKAFGRIPRLR